MYCTQGSFESSCDLVDLMCAVPELVKAITPEGWAGLLACNRQWRQFVRDNAQRVSINTADDIDTIFHGRWPRLSEVMLCNSQGRTKIDWKGSKREIQRHISAIRIVSQAMQLPKPKLIGAGGAAYLLARGIESGAW